MPLLQKMDSLCVQMDSLGLQMAELREEVEASHKTSNKKESEDEDKSVQGEEGRRRFRNGVLQRAPQGLPGGGLRRSRVLREVRWLDQIPHDFVVRRGQDGLDPRENLRGRRSHPLGFQPRRVRGLLQTARIVVKLVGGKLVGGKFVNTLLPKSQVDKLL